MNSPDAKTGAIDDPLTDFSQCHSTIIARFEEFRGLPDLLEPAAQARRIATGMLQFFESAVIEHHAEEEQDLFPAVIASAVKGSEREQVQVLIDRLVGEHRQIEAMWSRLEPALKDVAKGRDSTLDEAAVRRLVDTYIAHARFEEQHFLPLAQTILGRDGNHVSALGLSLHLRRTEPAILKSMAHW